MPATPKILLSHFVVPLLVGVGLFGSDKLLQAENVVVRLSDEHLVVGEVDAQTDDQRLWLRREMTGIQLCSGYEWAEVLTVWRGEHALSTDDFKKTVATVQTPAPPFANIPLLFNGAQQGEEIPAGVCYDASLNNAASNAINNKVQTVSIKAVPGRWGREIANDGLLVAVYPLSATGEIVPLQGQLDLTLVAARTNGNSDGTRQFDVREIESSSELVRVSDFRNGPAIYKLPFRRSQPDVDFEIGQHALVHALGNSRTRGVGSC